jgi:hypothetical protein
MKKYSFYIDTKVTVWERSHRTIEAESEEDAMKMAKDIFKDDWGQSELEVETLYDTQESMSVNDNGGFATSELIWPTNTGVGKSGIIIGADNVIMDNRPVAVVRDEKIDKILDEK